MNHYTRAPLWDSSVVWIWVKTCTWVMFQMPTMFLSQQDSHLDMLVKNCFVYCTYFEGSSLYKMWNLLNNKPSSGSEKLVYIAIIENFSEYVLGTGINVSNLRNF